MLQYDLNILQQPVGKLVNDWVPPVSRLMKAGIRALAGTEF
jgi:hypothetical protein